MGSQPRRFFDEEKGRGRERDSSARALPPDYCGQNSSSLTLSQLRAMGSAARSDATSLIADAPPIIIIRQTTRAVPTSPPPSSGSGGAFPYMMRQHANTIASAGVRGVFAAVPCLKGAARANFAGAPPPEDTWGRIGNVPWQPGGDRGWLQPYAGGVRRWGWCWWCAFSFCLTPAALAVLTLHHHYHHPTCPN
jgi:hypothetical protein